jgi:hypothetical protein
VAGHKTLFTQEKISFMPKKKNPLGSEKPKKASGHGFLGLHVFFFKLSMQT